MHFASFAILTIWPMNNGIYVKSIFIKSFRKLSKYFSNQNLLVGSESSFSSLILRWLILNRQYNLSLFRWWILTFISGTIRLLLCCPSFTSSIQSKIDFLLSEKFQEKILCKGSGFYPSSQPQLSNDLLENVQVHKMILELSASLNVRQLFLEGPLTAADLITSTQ